MQTCKVAVNKYVRANFILSSYLEVAKQNKEVEGALRQTTSYTLH